MWPCEILGLKALNPRVVSLGSYQPLLEKAPEKLIDLSHNSVLLLLETDLLERGYAQSQKKLTPGPAQTLLQLPFAAANAEGQKPGFA